MPIKIESIQIYKIIMAEHFDYLIYQFYRIGKWKILTYKLTETMPKINKLLDISKMNLVLKI